MPEKAHLLQMGSGALLLREILSQLQKQETEGDSKQQEAHDHIDNPHYFLRSFTALQFRQEF